MTPDRLAIILTWELHRAGFLNTAHSNPVCDCIEEALKKRIKYGDVKCIPNEHDIEMVSTKGNNDLFC